MVTDAAAFVPTLLPWCDRASPVYDVVRWRAAFPAARGAWCLLRPHADGGSTGDGDGTPMATLPARRAAPMATLPARDALAGLVVLHLGMARGHDKLIYCLDSLPPSLAELNLGSCHVWCGANFAQLPALASLDCSRMLVCGGTIASLPPSLVHSLASSALSRCAS